MRKKTKKPIIKLPDTQMRAGELIRLLEAALFGSDNDAQALADRVAQLRANQKAAKGEHSDN